jgi:hypothetical protein
MIWRQYVNGKLQEMRRDIMISSLANINILQGWIVFGLDGASEYRKAGA